MIVLFIMYRYVNVKPLPPNAIIQSFSAAVSYGINGEGCDEPIYIYICIYEVLSWCLWVRIVISFSTIWPDASHLASLDVGLSVHMF